MLQSWNKKGRPGWSLEGVENWTETAIKKGLKWIGSAHTAQISSSMFMNLGVVNCEKSSLFHSSQIESI